MHLFALLMLTLVANMFLLPARSQGQDWTRFRGPNGSGVSAVTTVPGQWTESDYNWKITLPGVGHSSPVAWKDRIYVMSADPDKATRYVICVNAGDGSILWNHEYPGVVHHKHDLNSFASCTPAVDDEHVYVAWSDPAHTLLKALDHAGNEAWTFDLGPWVSQHGFGTSPMLIDDLVVISKYHEDPKRADGGTPGESFIVALDRQTGKERWRTKRETDTTSYSVPCIRELASGEQELVSCSTAEGVFALDPQTGREKWKLPIITMRTVSSPILSNGLVIATTGSGGGGNYVVAVQPGADAQEVYRIKTQAPYVPTPVAQGGLLFLWYEKGIVSCVDAKTGELHWRERIGGNFWTSPIIVGDKLYGISDSGEVVVLAASKEYQLIGRMELGEGTRSTPCVSGGRMYIRTFSHLFSLGGKST
jgi:outer membrane protein assembly factor BamB